MFLIGAQEIRSEEGDEFMVFSDVAAVPGNPQWDNLIHRRGGLYTRADDIRSEFSRDYNRILHSTAYGRLKHKTQVFFATRNDHICTRAEHVNHVMSVSYSICKELGLNAELAMAIGIGHDLGHAPFGHHGEKILTEIMKTFSQDHFWHEKNSLWFVDNLETLLGPDGRQHTLDLTYAVRDGIVSHCGEVDENAIFPRELYIDLEDLSKPSEYQPYTWEGCVVKIADKISYLGRDIEDAVRLGFLSLSKLRELTELIQTSLGVRRPLRHSNTVLMHEFMVDLCKSSTPDEGIRFTDKYLSLMEAVKNFNMENIYLHPRLGIFKDYAKLIICSIYHLLADQYDTINTFGKIESLERNYPLLARYFLDWIERYSNSGNGHSALKINVVYDLREESQYFKAIIDFISGMTDSFAIRVFNEMTTF